MNRSTGALLSWASSTSLTTRAIVLSAAAAVTRMRNTASRLIVPANTVAAGPLRVGVLSPVAGASLMALSPSMISPSAGMRSPGRTTIVAPMRKLSAGTSRGCPRSSQSAVVDSSGRRNTAYVSCSEELVQSLGRCSPAQGLSRPAVEGHRHGCKVLGAVHAEIGALREVLPQQPVGVLVRAALPRAVRVAEVARHASLDPQLGVLGHLRSLIPGQRSSQLFGKGGDCARDGVAHRLSPLPSERG